jgi:thiamine-phosphate pyrophosphorylase
VKQSTLKRETFKSPFFYSYFITDPKEFGNTTATLKRSLENSFLKHQIDMICFRDKESKNIEKLAKTTLEISRKKNISKILINSNIELAIKLGFDGVHLTSQQFDKIEFAKQNNLFTIISTHTEDEIISAKEKGCNGITYSPIFFKENKGEPKGIENLTKIVEKYQDENFYVIALGGIITNNHLKLIKQTNANGFASIRYFK